VKADDVGIAMANTSSSIARVAGRGLVYGMPIFLKLLAAVGTAAMLWVGGSILVHGMAELGYAGPEHVIHDASATVVTALGFAPAIVGWFATSAMQAAIAILVGAIALVAMGNVVAPVWKLVRARSQKIQR